MMGYVIGAIIASLLFAAVGVTLIVYYCKSKINEDILTLHDNFVLTAVTYKKKLNGNLKMPGIFTKRKTLIQYILFTAVSLFSAVYFTVMLFTRVIH